MPRTTATESRVPWNIYFILRSSFSLYFYFYFYSPFLSLTHSLTTSLNFPKGQREGSRSKLKNISLPSSWVRCRLPFFILFTSSVFCYFIYYMYLPWLQPRLRLKCGSLSLSIYIHYYGRGGDAATHNFNFVSVSGYLRIFVSAPWRVCVRRVFKAKNDAKTIKYNFGFIFYFNDEKCWNFITNS